MCKEGLKDIITEAEHMLEWDEFEIGRAESIKTEIDWLINNYKIEE